MNDRDLLILFAKDYAAYINEGREIFGSPLALANHIMAQNIRAQDGDAFKFGFHMPYKANEYFPEFDELFPDWTNSATTYI